MRVKDVEWQRGHGDSVWLEIHVNPLVDADHGLLGVSIVFHDVTAGRALLDEPAHTNRQLELAHEELQSTNEELETTNAELQSTVEELETTNDEVQAFNDILRERSVELDEVNDFLESVLTSIRAGVVVVDEEMWVVAWNRGAEDLWGLRSDEARSRHLLNLDVGLPVADLRPAVRAALGDLDFEQTKDVPAVNRRIALRVHCAPLRTMNGTIRGSILRMEAEPPDGSRPRPVSCGGQGRRRPRPPSSAPRPRRGG